MQWSKEPHVRPTAWHFQFRSNEKAVQVTYTTCSNVPSVCTDCVPEAPTNRPTHRPTGPPTNHHIANELELTNQRPNQQGYFSSTTQLTQPIIEFIEFSFPFCDYDLFWMLNSKICETP